MLSQQCASFSSTAHLLPHRCSTSCAGADNQPPPATEWVLAISHLLYKSEKQRVLKNTQVRNSECSRARQAQCTAQSTAHAQPGAQLRVHSSINGSFSARCATQSAQLNSRLMLSQVRNSEHSRARHAQPGAQLSAQLNSQLMLGQVRNSEHSRARHAQCTAQFTAHAWPGAQLRVHSSIHSSCPARCATACSRAQLTLLQAAAQSSEHSHKFQPVQARVPTTVLWATSSTA